MKPVVAATLLLWATPVSADPGDIIVTARGLPGSSVDPDRLSGAVKQVPADALRHTFATMAVELGFSYVGALLGHASRGVTQRYVQIDRATKLAADEVSKAIQALL